MNQPHHEGEGLAACPFCGGTRIGGPYFDDRERLHYFACISNPGTACAVVYGASPEKARALWNRRPTPAEPSETGGEAEPESAFIDGAFSQMARDGKRVDPERGVHAVSPTPAAQDVERVIANLTSGSKGTAAKALLRSLTADLAAREATIAEQADKIDGLTEDLKSAVEVAFKRGAIEWVRLNYPSQFQALSPSAKGPAHE